MREDQFDQLGRAMGAAWSRLKRAQARMWGEWMIIGDGLLAGRQWAMNKAGTNKPEGKGYVVAFAEWLKRYKVDDMDKSDRAKLLQLMEERPAVEEWRATLTDYERRSLNNPIVVWRKWKAATRVKKPKTRTTDKQDHAQVEQQGARIEELEEALRAAQEQIGDLEAARGWGKGLADLRTAYLAEIELLDEAAQRVELNKLLNQYPPEAVNAIMLDLLQKVAGAQQQRDAEDSAVRQPAALIWEDHGSPWTDGDDGHHMFGATVESGCYNVTPKRDFPSRKLTGYWTMFRDEASGKTHQIGNARTADAAKKLAEADYAKRQT